MDNRIVAVVEPEGTGKPDDAEWGKIQSIGKEGSHDPIMWKTFIPISCHSRKSLPSSTRWRRRMVTNHLDAEKKLLFSSLRTSKILGAIPAGTIIGPISEVLIVKILDEYGVEVAIPSKCKPGDVTYVVISRETERFVVEIHTHAAKTRSSRELLDHLQESKESIFYKQREVTTSPKETWVAPSTGETRAGFVRLVPNQRVRRSRPLFMLIQDVEVIWQCLFPKLSQPCYVTSIKTNESLMDRDIVKLLNPYCWESLNEMESKISMTKCGYKRSLKAAQRKGLSTVKTTIDFMSFTSDSRAFWRNSNRTRRDGLCQNFAKLKETWTTEDFLWTFSPYCEKDWFQEERRKTKPVKQSF